MSGESPSTLLNTEVITFSCFHVNLQDVVQEIFEVVPENIFLAENMFEFSWFLDKLSHLNSSLTIMKHHLIPLEDMQKIGL